MNIENLFPHNRQAFVSVMQSFNSHDRAAVVHATGTGKAWIMGAVASQFSHPLILAPINFVLDEARKVNGDHADYMTYPALVFTEDIPTGYDFIGLDEFHRTGAEQWGSAVRRLLNANPDAKVLGTSATPIRYLDNHRNMADELLDGNIVSQLSINKAIDQHILPNPVYVSALYQIEDSITHTVKCINDNSVYTDEEREERLAKLREIKRSWEKSSGVSGIIAKYFTHQIKRVIVFCSSIREMEDIKHLLTHWFISAGYSSLRFYRFDYTQSNIIEQMNDYQLNDYAGLKIAISINMLNEGVHVPNVDAVIMLRSTASRIIIEQQIGRCLSAGCNDIRPVVLDLVCNMEVVSQMQRREGLSRDDFYSNFGIETDKADDDTCEGFPFEVIDACKDFRDFYLQAEDEFVSDPKWFKDILPRLEAFWQDNHRLPMYKDHSDLYSFIMRVRVCESAKQEWRVKWLEEHGFDMTVVDADAVLRKRMESVEIFVEDNLRMPCRNTEPEINASYRFLLSRRRKGNLPEDLKNRLEIMIDKFADAIWYYHYLPILEAYYDKHGHLPLFCEDRKLYQVIYKMYNTNIAKNRPHRVKWIDEHGGFPKRKNVRNKRD